MIKKLSLLSLASLSLFATNGTNLIGTGTVSRSMGGTGVAFFSSGVEAMGKNSALIARSKKNEVEMSVTAFFADVESQVADPNPLNPSFLDEPVKSQINWWMTFLPGMGAVFNVNDDINMGFAVIGAAGLGVNYKGVSELHQLESRMMFIKVVPTISYSIDNVNLGFSPVLGMGSMTINYDENMLDREGGTLENPDYTTQKKQSTRGGLFGTEMGGDDLEFSYGWQAGIDGTVNDKMSIGMTYQSSIKFNYKNVANFEHFGYGGFVWMGEEFVQTYQNGNADTNIALKLNEVYESGTSQERDKYSLVYKYATAINSALEQLQLKKGGDFTLANLSEEDLKGVLGQLNLSQQVANIVAPMAKEVLAVKNNNSAKANLDNLTLEQPWEAAIGFAYDPVDDFTVTMDYRYIAWGDAEGYQDFGWTNQSVIAMGAEMRKDVWKFRFGYNYAENPLAKVDPNEWGMGLVNVQGHDVFNQAMSMLTTVAFPAIVTTHFTAGLGYNFSDDLSLNGAVVYAPAVTYIAQGNLVPQVVIDTANTVAPYVSVTSAPYFYKTTMSQMSFSGSINYRF